MGISEFDRACLGTFVPVELTVRVDVLVFEVGDDLCEDTDG